jgi:prepilin-type N-terminal cleavage/methylation domain-containing protein
MRSPRPHPGSTDARRNAFTLVEVLVVVSVVALLAALLIPAVQSARQSARRAQCANNLRQLGLALNSYESSHNVYPQGSNGMGYSIHSMVLPNIDKIKLFNYIKFISIPIDRSNETARNTRLSVFLCPSGTSFKLCGQSE